MRVLLLSFLLTSISGCRVNHAVSGSADVSSTQTVIVDVTMRIDISGCMSLPDQDRLDCVTAVTDTLKELTDVAKVLFCWRSAEEQPGNAGANPAVTCGDIVSVENGHSNP